jgi:hypothetical protein
MYSDWFSRIEILQGRWQHGEKVGCWFSSGPERTLFKWDIYVPLVTKWLSYILIISKPILPSGLLPSGPPANSLYAFFLSHMCYTLHPSHSRSKNY